MDDSKQPLASTLIPKPTLLNSMQKIMQLPIDRGCAWNVMAYTINKDIIDEKGEIDDLRAVVFLLGSFTTEQLAIDHAKLVIEKTGHPNVQVVHYGYPAKITTKPDTGTVYDVPVDLKGKLIDMEHQELKEQQELYNQRQQIEKELMEECENEMDEHHVEHFKQACYRSLRHWTDYLQLQKQSEAMYQKYLQQRDILRAHFHAHPEHEKEFLTMLKNKLEARGEAQLYQWIENSYLTYKDTLLHN